MIIKDLWVGDRFKCVGDKEMRLWTYLEPHDQVIWARLHSTVGHGHIGDPICSFPITQEVEFVPPEVAENLPVRIDLLEAMVPLEALAVCIQQKRYAEMTEDFQLKLLESIDLLRQLALTT